MSKVVKVSDGAYQLIADVATRHQIFLIDALDNILFKEGNPIEEGLIRPRRRRRR